jgi:hypothetical protein
MEKKVIYVQYGGICRVNMYSEKCMYVYIYRHIYPYILCNTCRELSTCNTKQSGTESKISKEVKGIAFTQVVLHYIHAYRHRDLMFFKDTTLFQFEYTLTKIS